MPAKSWRWLAACIAIELAAAGGGRAAGPDFRAAVTQTEGITAHAIEDRHGHAIAIVRTSFPVTRALSDLAAAEIMKAYKLERGDILLRGTPSGSAEPSTVAPEILNALGTALNSLNPVRILSREGTLSVTLADGRCLASIAPSAGLRPEGCTGGNPVRGPIRTAFRIAEPVRKLALRSELPAAYPVQAIALGREVAILALGGDSQSFAANFPGLTVLPFSNDTQAPPDDPQIRAAIRSVLEAIGRKPR